MPGQLTCSVLALLIIVSPALAWWRNHPYKKSTDEEIAKKFPTDITFYDKNNDDVVDYEEFSFAVMDQFNLIDPTEARVAFKTADKDGDGKLDKTEIQSLDITVMPPNEDSERGFDLQAREENLERRGCSLSCSGWPPKCHYRCKFG